MRQRLLVDETGRCSSYLGLIKTADGNQLLTA